MAQDVQAFEAERDRLQRLAAGLLADPVEAQDVVQSAWLRLAGTGSPVDNLPGWLTTVTTRLCLDRLKARTPMLLGGPENLDPPASAAPDAVVGGDPAELAAVADTVGAALQVMLDRLSPDERVAFVLHDSFGLGFATIAALLDTTVPAARKLASRARAKVAPPHGDQLVADRQVVDAFMAAARGGDLARLVDLLAPDAHVDADEAARLLGTPERIEGRDAVAAFFNGAARAALPVELDGRPGAAWFDRGTARVVFDIAVSAGRVAGITFRADPDALARVRRRRDSTRHTPANPADPMNEPTHHDTPEQDIP